MCAHKLDLEYRSRQNRKSNFLRVSRMRQWISRINVFLRISDYLPAYVSLASYLLFIALIQFSHVKAGSQGIDFAIFSQVISEVAAHNRFQSSLIGTGWINFFTHHLSPYLYILGIVSKTGIPAGALLIAFHIVMTGALVVGIFKLFEFGTESLRIPLVLTFLVVLLPCFRTTILWETHDEILALPLLVWSLYAHRKGFDSLKLILLLPALLFKETLGFNIFCITLFFAIDRPKMRRSALGLGLFSVIVSILYIRIFPRWLWWPSFDGSVRISSFDELVDFHTILQKSRWFLITLSPSVPFLFLHTKKTIARSFLLLIPAVYNFGAILISNFPNMYRPYEYYSVTPALWSFLSFSLPVRNSPYLLRSLLGSLLLIVSLGSWLDPLETLTDSASRPSARQEVESIISADKVVIADDYSATLFIHNALVMRLYHANKTTPKFDYIVLRKGHDTKLSLYLRSWSQICADTERFVVRCGLEKVRP